MVEKATKTRNLFKVNGIGQALQSKFYGASVKSFMTLYGRSDSDDTLKIIDPDMNNSQDNNNAFGTIADTEKDENDPDSGLMTNDF